MVVSQPVLDRWNNPAWRSWAKLYSEGEYREAELMAAVNAQQELCNEIQASLQKVVDWLSNPYEWTWTRMIGQEDAARRVLDRLVQEGVIDQVPNPPDAKYAFQRTFRVKPTA